MATPDTEKADSQSQKDQTASGIERVLAHNTPEFVDEISAGDLGNVLITGATGFLGVHVLHELLNRAKKIYAVVRTRKDRHALKRLNAVMYYYFELGDKAIELFREKVVVLDGDSTDREFMESLYDLDVQTVINCAASVKHFADFDALYKINVSAVENLADLCLATGARLVHVSTVSVAGDFVGPERADMVLTESMLDMGQDIAANAYVHTKYLAEELILQKVAD